MILFITYSYLIQDIKFFYFRLGFLIIDECPSVDTRTYSSALLNEHKKSMTELIRRDKNRPSVIMWSISNEPTAQIGAYSYFKKVVEHTKMLDPTRPVTIAIAQAPKVSFEN